MKGRVTKEQLLDELRRMRQQLELLDSCKQEMQFVQAKYERLLESAPDAMLFVNRDARIMLINAQMEKLFGYTEQELAGKDLHILIPERYRGRHRDNFANYFSNPYPRPMGSGLEIRGLIKQALRALLHHKNSFQGSWTRPFTHKKICGRPRRHGACRKRDRDRLYLPTLLPLYCRVRSVCHSLIRS